MSSDRYGPGSQLDLPKENQIYQGSVAKVEAFGAFVEIRGFKNHGLVHISHLSKDRVENVFDVVSVGQEVYVKVLSVESGEGNRPRISLSMKLVSQGDGSDRDPSGIEAERGSRMRKSMTGGKDLQQPLTLDAVYKTVCAKCGGAGHLAAECFNIGGVKYDLIEEEEEETRNQQRRNDFDSRSGRSLAGSRGNTTTESRGRGRGAILPAWMTDSGNVEPGNSNSSDSRYSRGLGDNRMKGDGYPGLSGRVLETDSKRKRDDEVEGKDKKSKKEKKEKREKKDKKEKKGKKEKKDKKEKKEKKEKKDKR